LSKTLAHEHWASCCPSIQRRSELLYEHPHEAEPERLDFLRARWLAYPDTVVGNRKEESALVAPKVDDDGRRSRLVPCRLRKGVLERVRHQFAQDETARQSEVDGEHDIDSVNLREHLLVVRLHEDRREPPRVLSHVDGREKGRLIELFVDEGDRVYCRSCHECPEGRASLGMGTARRDGSAWTQAVGPPAFGDISDESGRSLWGNAGMVGGLWGNGPNDVWAVLPTGTLVHWNGVAWTQAAGEVETGAAASVWGSGPDDLWVVGYRGIMLHYHRQGFASPRGRLAARGPGDQFAPRREDTRYRLASRPPHRRLP
jgi:hypothetical protein